MQTNLYPGLSSSDAQTQPTGYDPPRGAAGSTLVAKGQTDGLFVPSLPDLIRAGDHALRLLQGTIDRLENAERRVTGNPPHVMGIEPLQGNILSGPSPEPTLAKELWDQNTRLMALQEHLHFVVLRIERIN